MSFKIINPVKNFIKNVNLQQNLIKTFPRNQSGFTDSSYIKTSMVRISPEEGVPLQITSFNEYGFSINNNIKVLGPIVIFPKTIYSWNVADVNEINEKSLLLFKLLEPKIDILVLGIGDKYSKVSPEVPKWLIKNKLNNFEILPTEKAINVFNFLIAENRFAAAALLPSAIIREVDPSVKRVLELSNLYRENEDELPKDDKKKLT